MIAKLSGIANFGIVPATVPLLPAVLFPLHYSISSSFEILHSRLAKIHRKPYEIDENQPDFVMIGLTR